MRSIDNKINETDIRFLSILFSEYYFDIKSIKDYYLDTLTESEKTLILNSFEFLEKCVTDIENYFHINKGSIVKNDELGYQLQHLFGLQINFEKVNGGEYICKHLEDFIKPMFTKCFQIEEDCKGIACKIWNDTLTDVQNFDAKNFKLLAYKITTGMHEFKSYKNYLNNAECRRVSTSLITNSNTATFQEHSSEHGLIYKLTPKNFLGGCMYDAFSSEEEDTFSLNWTDERQSKNSNVYKLFQDNDKKVYAGLGVGCASNYATKTITPYRVEMRDRQDLYNEIILDYLNTKPEAVFYFCYGNPYVTSCDLEMIRSLAEYYDVPILPIDRIANMEKEDISYDMQCEIAKSLYFKLDIPRNSSSEFVPMAMKGFEKIMEVNPKSEEEYNQVIDTINEEFVTGSN